MPNLFFCQYLFRKKTLLMSAWIELACLLGSIFLVSSIGVCLKCFPPLVCQCLSSGSLGFLLRRASRRFSRLLPSVSQQSYLSGCFPCFWWSWYPIFFSLWRVPTGCLPLGLPRFCFKSIRSSSGLLLQDLSDLLLVLLQHNILSRLYKLPTCK